MALPRLNRRGFASALVVLAPATRAAMAQPEVQRQTRLLMGTQVRLVVPGRASELAPVLAAAWAEMQRLEAMLSRYRSDNPLAELARQAGRRPLGVPVELRELLQQAQGVSARTAGAFDVSVGAYSDWQFGTAQSQALPSARRLAEQRRAVNWRAIEIDGEQVLLNRPGMKLDLGGIAKLPILEAGLQELRRQGVRDALIDGGGDVRAIGQIDGRAWRVGLRDPLAPERLLGVVDLQDGWAASSGDYERGFVRAGRRYHHILDPRTGLPTEGVRGVSLLAQDHRQVNGLGAAWMVAGGAAVAQGLPAGVAAVAVQADGRRWQNAALAARLLPA